MHADGLSYRLVAPSVPLTNRGYAPSQSEQWRALSLLIARLD